MPRAFTFIALTLAAAVSTAATLAAQQPRITNGQVAAERAGSPFTTSFKSLVASQPDVTWIGYAVPTAQREGTMCCFTSGSTFVSGTVVMSDGSGWRGGCRLEPSQEGRAAAPSGAAPQPGPIKLEGPDHVVVLFRVAERRVERIRVYSEGCDLDAGGRPFRWLEQVNPADSVALLESFIGPEVERRDKVATGALSALAMHAAPQALAALIRMARSHEVAAVRGEAIFWLGQKAGQRAAAEITERIEQDPDTEVKKRAVFALSQLPKDEGVPLLITVARTHANPAVRKQAMFWLGQSKDPRALDFFAEILR